MKRCLEYFSSALDDDVGQVQDRLSAAVVFFQADDAGAGKELGKVDDVAEIGAAKGVYALRVVAHHHDVAVGVGQMVEDVGLDPVGVLVFIDHDVAVGSRDAAADLRCVLQQTLEPDEQVVVIHEMVFAFASGVPLEDVGDGIRLIGQVRVIGEKDVRDRSYRVGRAAEDVGECILARQRRLPGRPIDFLADHRDERLRVGAIQDGEIG